MALSPIVKRLYGGGSDQAARTTQPSEANSRVGEALVVSTTANARMFKGPQQNAHFSIHVRNLTASGAASTITWWYSNLPNPDPAVDSDWVQDTSITAIDLTVANATYMVNVGNVNAEWIRVKPSVAVSAGTLYAYTRVEGVDNR